MMVQKSNKRIPILEIVKTVLCVILFFAMLAQGLLYFAYAKRLNAAGDDDLHSLLVLKSGEQHVQDQLEFTSFFQPAFVGVRHYEAMKGISCGSEAMRDVYAMLAPVVELLTGPHYSCERLDAADAALWDNAFLAENYIFLSFRQDFLLQTIRFCTAEEYTPDFFCGCTGDHFLVKEFLILPYSTQNGMYSASALLRGSDGSLARLVGAEGSSENYVSLGELYAAIFNNPYFYDFTFACESATDLGTLVLSDRTVITDERFSLRPVSDFFSDADEIAEEQLSPDLLRAFCFNPDKTYRYYEQQDSAVNYLENFGTLHAESGGILHFSAGEGQQGIPLSEYLSYADYDDSYDFYEVMAAAMTLVSRVMASDENLFGGAADISLYEICRSDDDLLFRFIYTYDNLPILSADASVREAFSVTVQGNLITSVTAHCAKYLPDGSQMQLFSQEWICQRYAQSIGGRITATLSVAYLSLPLQERQYIADWILVPDFGVSASVFTERKVLS